MWTFLRTWALLFGHFDIYPHGCVFSSVIQISLFKLIEVKTTHQNLILNYVPSISLVIIKLLY